ncbi:aminotransferase class III-fold pyridoxal phosphate-dependent enzyme [Mariniblastus fucicola]|uniref:Glutamate-1-semialdehyde 2,1-aminomutase n=2 Tax=Mariniblastus fucicola TaxID=980251 RepID=A0A5B9PBQ2_9BACT|nr:aminotransferase class III-fold pyridoxal phosphate-dependent enzyme [Mariniblastus fucicola]QEG22342.1 Glutamate-1-semialdehyde 2,1-aminomutase [Mariniblastus fucicola]
MLSDSINLKLLEHHARLTAEARYRLLYHRFDPHLQQPIYGERVLPKFSKRASGCQIWDILGSVYLDWTGSSDSNLLGHRHPAVVDAIKQWAIDEPAHELDEPAACDGPLTDPREVSLAKKFADVFNHGDELLVGFTRGRSEALYCATEMARTLTGRPMIAVHEVHSNRPLFAEDQRFRFTRSHFEETNVKTIPLDDVKAIEWLLKTNPDQLAAVVINPPTFQLPPTGYYKELHSLLQKHGTLLILDESETAFRLDIGGAQQHFSIAPDITVTGEKLGGAFAFSAVLGRKELLGRAWRSTMRTLDRPGGLTLDVVEAAFDVVVGRCLPSELRHVGSQLRDGFNDFAQEQGFPCQLVGDPTRLALQFDAQEFLTPEQLRAAFCMFALEEGLITHGEFWPNAAHNGDALFDTMRMLERTTESMTRWMREIVKPEEAIGEPFSKFELRGRIDALNMIRKTMVLTGWVLIDGEPVELSAVDEDGTRVAAEQVQRKDLAAGMPNSPQANNAGFKLSVEVQSIKKPSRFLIEAHRDGKLIYRTLLVHDPAEQSSAPYPFRDGYIFT